MTASMHDTFIFNVGPNGAKVTIDSGKPGKTIAIRADFDALPIQELWRH
jgi:metal-dependent amidase/aminoacylase/carboxypeptidase family protein